MGHCKFSPSRKSSRTAASPRWASTFKISMWSAVINVGSLLVRSHKKNGLGNVVFSKAGEEFQKGNSGFAEKQERKEGNLPMWTGITAEYSFCLGYLCVCERAGRSLYWVLKKYACDWGGLLISTLTVLLEASGNKRWRKRTDVYRRSSQLIYIRSFIILSHPQATVCLHHLPAKVSTGSSGKTLLCHFSCDLNHP